MDENGNGKAEGMATDGDFDLELERLIRAGRSLLEVRDTERSGEEMREMLEKLAEEQAQIEEVKEFWPQPVWKYLRYGPCGITQKVYLDAPECFAVECREPGWKDNLVTMFRMVTDIFGAWDPSLAVVLARARDLYMAENCAVQEEEDDEGNLDGQENDDGAGRDCFAEPRNDNSRRLLRRRLLATTWQGDCFAGSQ